MLLELIQINYQYKFSFLIKIKIQNLMNKFIILLLLIVQIDVQAAIPKLSTNLQNFLGSEAIKIISQPDSIESFTVGPETTSKSKQLAGFPILQVRPKLSSEQMLQLQNLILDKNSYLFDVNKKCLFRPDIGLIIKKGSQELKILLSFSCAIWMFVHNDEEKIEDFDPIYKQLQSIFPI